MLYTLRFFPLQNAGCFIMLTALVPVLFTFYIQCVLKLKKNNSGAIGLMLRYKCLSHLVWFHFLKLYGPPDFCKFSLTCVPLAWKQAVCIVETVSLEAVTTPHFFSPSPSPCYCVSIWSRSARPKCLSQKSGYHYQHSV